MKILRKLALDGKVIIATIHQPSTLMFQEMDKLMLLGKGRVLYLGDASKIVNYMMEIGVEVNSRMNPADFFMLEVSDFRSAQGYTTPMTADNFIGYQSKYYTVEGGYNL
jgi:ABC-type multidrug transport system ATPase subunit